MILFPVSFVRGLVRPILHVCFFLVILIWYYQPIINRDNRMSQEEQVEQRLKMLEAENEKMKDKLDRIKLLISSMGPVLKNNSE